MLSAKFSRVGALALLIFGAAYSGQLAFAQSLPFVTSFSNSVVRNNYTGFVGMQFTVGATPLYVTQLGRLALAGNSQTHIVKLVNAQTGVDIPNGSVSVLPNSAAGSFTYVTLPNVAVLLPNTSYLLLSHEVAGGDTWYDYNFVGTANVGNVNNAIYQNAAGSYVAGPGYSSYVPVNFQYRPVVTITSPAPNSIAGGSVVTYSANINPAPGLTITGVQFQLGDSPTTNLSNYGPVLTQAPFTLQENISSLYPGPHSLVVNATDSSGTVSSAYVNFIVGAANTLITGFSGTALRNNYSGFVGLEFTVGSTPITATSLGRFDAGLSYQPHTVKLVNASTGIDVPGGSASVTPGGSGVFAYAQLPNPLSLSANTSYLLLSLESSGGDQWYDYSPVSSSASGVSINAAVYSNSAGAYVLLPNTANYSYVPVNLTYSTSAGVAPGSVTVTSPSNNSIFTTGAITFSANAAPAAGLTLSSLQFILDQNLSAGSQTPIGPALTQPPFTLQVDTGLIDGSAHTVVAVMTDSGGNATTSAPVNFVVATDTIPFLGGLDAGYPGKTGVLPPGQMYGMQFTVGSAPLTITRLGLYLCCQTQPVNVSVKLVDAASGLDVPGGAVTFPANDSFPNYGGYSYGSLPAAIVLQPNESYYLLSPSGAAFNPGFFVSPLVTSAAATVNYPAYKASNNTYSVAPNLPGYTYSPVTFESQVATAIAPTVAIQKPSPNSTVSGTVLVIVPYGGAPPLAIDSVQIKLDGVNLGPPTISTDEVAISNTSFELTLPLDTTAYANGLHVLTAVAVDSNGTQSTSLPVTFTINNPASTQSTSPAFVTAFNPTFLRNNFTGFLGFKFTVASAPLQISSLGRLCAAGNSASHTVKLVTASTGIDISGSSVSVSLSGCKVGQFVYSALASPITLPAGTSVYLVDQESSGGDQWYDYSPLTVSAAATVNGPVYANGPQWVTVSAPGSSYVPLNFLFTTPSAGGNPTFAASVYFGSGNQIFANVVSSLPVTSLQFEIDGYPFGNLITNGQYVLPFIPELNYGTHLIVAVAHDSAGNTATSLPQSENLGILQSNGTYASSFSDVIKFTGTNLRNNYSGWVGMRLTTGNSPSLLNTSNTFYQNQFTLGRLCSAGNSMVHIIKLVNASNGTDVPNALGWLNMSGCAAGSIVDAAMPGVVLAANTSYYLLTQESNGGDSWYDVSPAVPLSSVTVPLPPIQSDGGYFSVPVGAAFTIDGPAYSAANGSLVFVPQPNYSFVGLSVGGLAYNQCASESPCSF